MTDQEAIERAQKELDNSTYLAEVGNNAGLRTMHQNRVRWLLRVLRLARIALREQEERENPKQLTIEELRQMNGEPVWVAELSGLVDQTGWALVEVDDRGYYKDIPFVRCHICQWNVISRKLHCYRYKPKES